MSVSSLIGGVLVFLVAFFVRFFGVDIILPLFICLLWLFVNLQLITL